MGKLPSLVAQMGLEAAADAYVWHCIRSGLRPTAAVVHAARKFGVSERTIWRWREQAALERNDRHARVQALIAARIASVREQA